MARAPRAAVAATGGGPARTVAVAALGILSGCGATIVDHTPAGNLLAADTAGLEGGIGHWEAWYSVDVARTTADARRGRASLRIAVTAPDGWGVQLDNWPGFPAAPGRHHVDLWVRAVSSTALDLEASIRWRDEAGGALQTDVVRVRPNDTWQPGDRDLIAPAGTTRAALELTGSEGGPGDRVDVDEIFLL
jgi:hypothetical protein